MLRLSPFLLMVLWSFSWGESFHDENLKQSRALISNSSSSKNELIGTYKLLALRVTSPSFGQEPMESLQEIEDTLFGAEYSVASQFAAISHHQLIYERATSTGVVEIEMQQRLGRYEDDEDVIIQAAEEKLGVSSILDVADRVLLCLPDGSLDDGVWGLAQFPGRRSYYHKQGCTKLSLILHELGHNAYFDHSGVGDDEYEDRSGYMGGSENLKPVGIIERIVSAFRWGDGEPLRRAFNGHKHWISGWFENKQTTLDLSAADGSILETITCFVDADKSAETVLLRVGSIYIQFNCAKEYNIHAEVPNTVTLTRAPSDRVPSDRLAALAQGESFQYTFEDDGEWMFHVCSIGDNDDEVTSATLSIHEKHAISACPSPAIPPPKSWSIVVDNSLRSNHVLPKLLGCLVLVSFGLIAMVGIQACCDCVLVTILRKIPTRNKRTKELKENQPLSPSNPSLSVSAAFKV